MLLVRRCSCQVRNGALSQLPVNLTQIFLCVLANVSMSSYDPVIGTGRPLSTNQYILSYPWYAKGLPGRWCQAVSKIFLMQPERLDSTRLLCQDPNWSISQPHAREWACNGRRIEGRPTAKPSCHALTSSGHFCMSRLLSFLFYCC